MFIYNSKLFKVKLLALAFCLTSVISYAQCPTIPSSPIVICDAAGFNFSDLSAFATDTGGGIVWYDSAISTTALPDMQLVAEGTYYADDVSDSCAGARPSITVDFTVDASGAGLFNGIYCSNDNATFNDYYNEVISSFIPAGTVSTEIYFDFDLTSPVTFANDIPLGFTNLFIVFVDGSGCTSQIENGRTAVDNSPLDPTPPSPQQFCSDTSPTIASLNPGTTGLFNWYANIDGLGNVIPPALNNALALVDGNTYYVQAESFFCDSNPVPVIVEIDDPVEAGNPLPADFCETDLAANSPIDLFDYLTGEDAGGTWTDDNASGALFGVSMVDLTLLTDGTYNYTYTVPGVNACPDDTATVVLIIYPVLSSGTTSVNSPAQFCESLAPTDFDLNSLLDNEDPGGQWTQGPLSTDPIVTSPIDLSGFTPGMYVFTYTQNVAPNPCPEESTQVEVEILLDPIPGVAIPATFCENDLTPNPFDLFNALDGSQDNNLGTWTDASGNVVTNPIDISTFDAANSPYVFTYTISNASCTDSEDVTLTVLPAPESGTVSPDSPISFCLNEAPSSYDLFDLLDGEDQTGVWYSGTDNTGAVVANPTDLSVLIPGNYFFTFDVTEVGTCDDVLVTVEVIINDIPNTGTPNNPAPFCISDPALNDPAFDLFDILIGEDTGGTWSDDDASGVLTGNTIDLSSLPVGVFNYTYTITDANNCTNSTTVTITILDAPESGTVSAASPISFCIDALPSSYDLFDLLDGEDQTGVWHSGTDNTGAIIANPTDLSVLTAGNYFYTFDVDAIGTCDDVLVTVEVIINDLPNTGTPNNPAPVCANDPFLNDSAFDLFDILTGEDAGGTWSDDDASGVLTGNTIDLSSLPAGIFNYTYTITDANNCSNSTTVTITILDAPESGTVSTASPISFCIDALPSSYDLFDLLDGEDQTGVWHSGTDNTGAIIANPTDLSVLTAGNYFYTFDVDAIGTCDDVLVTVEVIINDLPNTGTATPFVVCETTTNTSFDLFDQLSGNDAGGSWLDDDASGELTGNTVDISALPVGTFNYTYTITDANSCSNSSTVVITIEDAPNAGTATNFNICLIDLTTTPTLDLFNQLTGEDSGGVWMDDDTSGALTDNNVDLNALTINSTFNFTYTVTGVGTCSDDTETVSVTVTETNAPTLNAIQNFCDSATVGDLTVTSGTNIQWYDDATLGSPLPAGTVLVDGENYYASQTDIISNCESVSRTEVVVTIFLSPNSGIAVNGNICNTVTAYDLFSALDGSEDGTGTWTDTDATGALSGSTFDASSVTPGDYDFTYTVVANAPCVNASTIVTISVETPVTAGTDDILILCSTDTSVDLFPILGGATTGGDWSLNGVILSNVLDPATAVSGTYIYTIASACNVDTAEIDVTINQAPDAGLDNTISFCVADGTVDLLTQLGGTPDTNGTWSPLLNSGTNIFDPALDGTGNYTYTVNAVSPCTINAMATLNITVNDAATPITTVSSATFCLVNSPTVADLNALVTGNNIEWYNDATSIVPLPLTDALIDGEDYYSTQTNSTSLCISSVRAQIDVIVSDEITPTLIFEGELFCINDNPTIETLTANIIEVNPTLSNVVWYDTITGGTAYTSTDILIDGETYYAALIHPTTNCESSIRLMVTVDLSACGTLDIPDGFSPNGDGVNDSFTINNIEFLYPNYDIEFYNRYGSLVYKSNANIEDFKGRSNQSRVLSKTDLPVGVYYYILNYNYGITKAKQGRLYLNR
ncbi:gliding motility-associated C-terminal domain-containing protein [Aurantibacter sp.]|uniref:Ig-like domain-containing protein n=1 Tax=Aurantibacter sp. TaxID=2807103 RepID=UPI0035C851A4